MSKELKPCPFCGSENIKIQSGSGLDLNTQYNGRYVYCGDCKVFKQVISYFEWNQRPENKYKKILDKLTDIIKTRHANIDGKDYKKKMSFDYGSEHAYSDCISKIKELLNEKD